ncbi:taste receptor type 1 member 1 [Calypte anna]|uniref:taste receptor type 1 member 1 n=1 Tax=Calypte anna TaxID=9244 RepID=UPI0011C4AA3A|nr:taste receptor type 1 member 1 [Calypte anna]
MPLPALLCLCAAAAASTARGDYRLAGLFPMHSPQPRDAPQPLVDSCDDPTTFKYHGYALSQAMRFAVEEINNSSTLLPNITLGYDIYDTCSEPANLHATLRALVQKDGREVEVLSTFRNYEPQAVAVIGPDCSDVALTTAAVLSVFLVPVISYEASSEVLSQKRLYPSFLRTIPSDGQQVKAIFQLMKNFGWNWVALLGSNNAYGRDGLDALQRLLNENNMCVAYRGTFALNADASSQELHNLAAILRDIKVNVTVIFANRQSVHPFFKVMVQRNVTGMVWVGSEDWSLDQTIRQIPGIQNIGTVIGISVEMMDPAMVERFVSWKAEKSPVAEQDDSVEGGGENGGSAQLDCTQRCTACHLSASALDTYDTQASFNVYSAVYTVAHGLHDLLGCASGACSKGTVYPWQLLEKIKQVNFTLYKNPISFDDGGDIHKGYDIIMWNWSSKSSAFDVIGTFSVNPDRLIIDQDKILWHTEDNQAPTSQCSKGCQPGERQVQQNHHRCCFTCMACPPETFLNRSGGKFDLVVAFVPQTAPPRVVTSSWHVQMSFAWDKQQESPTSESPATVTNPLLAAGHLAASAYTWAEEGGKDEGGEPLNTGDLYSCQSCGADQWSPVSSEACFNRTIEFLSWFDPISWALLIPTVLLLLLMAGLAVLFALNFSTPVVKSAGGKMCFFMLGSLACSCSSIFCYFGEPTLHTCLLRHPLYAISFSIFLSCMTTRSFQIICIFKLNARWPALYEAWLRRGGPVLFIAASTAAQTGLCLAVEAASPSVPRRNYDTWPDRVALECGGAGWVSATAYTVLLSACCFALSYAGKDLPASYNEAKCLTCSLLLHLACSAAVLCTQGAFRGRAQATVQVLSSLCTLGALMAGYFFPKAFVILLRPHLNTPEHFQMAIQSYTRRLADS